MAENDNVTIAALKEVFKNEWTLATLKEFLEAEINAGNARCLGDISRLESDAKHVAENLTKDAAEVARQLIDLNHENARVNAANALNVSNETYGAFINENTAWRSRVEKSLTELVTRTEYNAYKEATQNALSVQTGVAAVQTGRREAISGSAAMLFTVVAAVVAAGSMIVAIMEFNRGAAPIAAAPAPQPLVIYPQAQSAPGPTAPTTTTTTTKP